MCEFLYYRKKYGNTQNPIWDMIKTEVKLKRGMVISFFECLIDISANNLLRRGWFGDSHIAQACYLTEMTNKKGFAIVKELLKNNLLRKEGGEYTLVSFDKYNPKFNNIENYEEKNLKNEKKETKICAKQYHNWYNNILAKASNDKGLNEDDYTKLEQLQEYFKNDSRKLKNIQELLRKSQENSRIFQEHLRTFKNDNITNNKITDNKHSNPPITPPNENHVDNQFSLIPDSKNDNTTFSKTKLPQGVDANFERFWKEYPKKVDKQLARKKFIEVVQKNPALVDIIIASATAYAIDCQSKNTDPQYIKHAKTWLNNECWNNTYSQNVSKMSIDKFCEDLVKDNAHAYYFLTKPFLRQKGYTEEEITKYTNNVSTKPMISYALEEDYLGKTRCQHFGFTEPPPKPQ
jgi:hypothetical protein